MTSNIKLPIKNIYHCKPFYTKKRRPYKKYKYADWNIKDVLEEALILKETDNNYLELISEKYGIIKDTLKNKIHNYVAVGVEALIDKRGKHNKNFSEEEEEIISDHIKINYINRGLPFDNTYLKLLSESFFNKRNDINENINNTFKASDGWCTDFKKRWNISSVKPSLKRRHLNNDNMNEINIFIAECTNAFKEVGIDYFFNADETFWRIINAVQTMFGHTGSESTILNYIGNEKEGFTTLLCINSNGSYLDPIIIKKGKTDRCLKSLNVPDNIKKCHSDSGWISNDIMIFLLNNIKVLVGNNKSVLVLDQYSVHTTDIVIEEANKKIYNLYLFLQI